MSECLDLAARGERVLIFKRNRPIAERRAVESVRTEPRPVDLARGRAAQVAERSASPADGTRATGKTRKTGRTRTS